jgi:hypothetical protein
MNTQFKKKRFSVALVPCLALSLIGCEESAVESTTVVDEVTNNDAAMQSLSVDASHQSNWTYVNIADNILVSDSDTWHLAFQRYRVKSNDAVTASIAEKQSDWYDADGEAILSAFVSGTADTEVDEFNKIYEESELETIANEFVAAIGNDWYSYDASTHSISENSANKWFVLNNDGKKATKVWVSAFDGQTQTLSYQTIEADALTAEKTIDLVLGEPSVAQCVDFDTAAIVDCTSADWDYSLETASSGRGYLVRTNGGESGTGSGGAYGPLTESESAEVSLNYISYYISQDRTQGVFDQYVPFEYGINNDHFMYANFRTYVIKTDAQSFNVRLTDYYNGAGDSGYITLQTLAK